MLPSTTSDGSADATENVARVVGRRALVKRGTAVGAMALGVVGLARMGLAAQEGTPAAGPATPGRGGGTAAIVSAAESYLATLDESERVTALFAYPSEQTLATATDFSGRVGEQFGDAVWSNYPISDVIRPGIRTGDMSEAQREAAMTLVATTLSTAGYQKVLEIMASDQALSSGGTQYASGEDNYVLGLFGTPSETERWMLQFGGHHLALNVAIQGEERVLAPMLTGCQPATFDAGDGTTVRPLGAETDDGFALINALDADQQAQAILSYAVGDLVLGPGHDGQELPFEGIQASALNEEQQALLLKLVGNWVGILDDDAAEAKLADIQARLDDTYFAWSGDTAAGSASYFRVTGPTFIIEFAPQGAMGGGPGGGAGGGGQGTPPAGGMQRPGGAQGTPGAGGGTGPATGTGDQNPYETGGANHIHSVYRDPTNEYGTHLGG